MAMRAPSSLQFSPEARSGLRTRRMARRLGWLSVALGAMELLAPVALARAVGTRGRRPARVVARRSACGSSRPASGS